MQLKSFSRSVRTAATPPFFFSNFSKFFNHYQKTMLSAKSLSKAALVFWQKINKSFILCLDTSFVNFWNIWNNTDGPIIHFIILSFFLKAGKTSANFSSLGNIPHFRQLLKLLERLSIKVLVNCWMSLVDTLKKLNLIRVKHSQYNFMKIWQSGFQLTKLRILKNSFGNFSKLNLYKFDYQDFYKMLAP